MIINLDTYHLSVLEKTLKDLCRHGPPHFFHGGLGYNTEISLSVKEEKAISFIHDIILRRQEYDAMPPDKKISTRKGFWDYMKSTNEQKYTYIMNKYKQLPDDLFQLDIVEAFLDYHIYLIKKIWE